MRRVQSSFLRRALTLVWIGSFAIGLGGCVWHDGHSRGWGWKDRHHHSNDGDHPGRGRGHDKHHDHDRDDD